MKTKPFLKDEDNKIENEWNRNLCHHTKLRANQLRLFYLYLWETCTKCMDKSSKKWDFRLSLHELTTIFSLLQCRTCVDLIPWVSRKSIRAHVRGINNVLRKRDTLRYSSLRQVVGKRKIHTQEHVRNILSRSPKFRIVALLNPKFMVQSLDVSRRENNARRSG